VDAAHSIIVATLEACLSGNLGHHIVVKHHPDNGIGEVYGGEGVLTILVSVIIDDNLTWRLSEGVLAERLEGRGMTGLEISLMGFGVARPTSLATDVHGCWLNIAARLTRLTSFTIITGLGLRATATDNKGSHKE